MHQPNARPSLVLIFDTDDGEERCTVSGSKLPDGDDESACWILARSAFSGVILVFERNLRWMSELAAEPSPKLR
jgi:hypothetical protein